jgi:hypothetical protein
MKHSNWGGILEMAVRAENKPAVYINNSLKYNSKDQVVWQYVLNEVQDNDIRMNLINGGLFFFEDSELSEDFFRIFDSKPAYASGIYAMLFDAAGRCLTENT